MFAHVKTKCASYVIIKHKAHSCAHVDSVAVLGFSQVYLHSKLNTSAVAFVPWK